MELNSFYNLYENNLISNVLIVIVVTAIAFILSCILPLSDKKISDYFGINLYGGIDSKKSASIYGTYRRIILYIVFTIYLVVLFYLVLFARSKNVDYLVRNSGINLFIMSWQGGTIPSMEFMEFYLNMVLFIPMGYLLPYIFKFFRAHSLRRPLLASFLMSVLIENLQLMTKRGTYDTSDIIANTLGALIGAYLYLQLALILTNPDWRKDHHNYVTWKRLAKNGALFFYAKKLDFSRINLLASSEEEIWEFYVKKLGFQLRRFVIPEDTNDCYFLFALGKSRIEIHCTNDNQPIPKQSITLTCDNLDKLKNHLQKFDIPVSDFETDIYSRHKMMKIIAPDNVELIFLEL